MTLSDRSTETPPTAAPTREQLLELVRQWSTTARAKFRCGAQEPEEFPRRFIEHGAVCYANCAIALHKLIKAGD